ncbi:DUF814 domain-containing protein [Candidatus Pacearchaeota archaeon]|nr:DUF814 domain-containing protein [Candidatus Pacearchaeota archaeon]
MKKLKSSKKENAGKQDYEKYRWFFTSGNKLVIGGKNAEQNEEVVRKAIKENGKLIVMHTSSPGSPFSVIMSENPSESDLEETAIFTGCFSRVWRERKEKAAIDIFLAEQLIKKNSMKTGTFGVVGEIDRKLIKPKLYLIKQKSKLRAVPFKTDKAISIIPGNINKEEFAEQIAIKMEIPVEEVLQALPTGGFQILK